MISVINYCSGELIIVTDAGVRRNNVVESGTNIYTEEYDGRRKVDGTRVKVEPSSYLQDQERGAQGCPDIYICIIL